MKILVLFFIILFTTTTIITPIVKNNASSSSLSDTPFDELCPNTYFQNGNIIVKFPENQQENCIYTINSHIELVGYELYSIKYVDGEIFVVLKNK